MKKLIYGAAAGLMALSLPACSDDSSAETNGPTREIAMTRGETEAVADLSDFSLKLFDNVVSERSDNKTNISISPLATSMMLGMIANGVEGETKADLLKAMLGDENASIDELNQLMAKLMEELPSLDNKVDVKMANSMWHTTSISPSDAFRNSVEASYGAHIDVIDFNSPEHITAIDRWASECTAGSLDAIYRNPGINKPNRLFYSLVCFDGKWSRRFDKSKTKPTPFHNADGTTTDVPMMDSGTSTYPVKKSEDYVAVSLPYGNGAYSIDLFLPAEGSTTAELASKLADGGWRRHTMASQVDETAVKLPRFRVECHTDFENSLKACGLESLYTSSDDFIQMGTKSNAMGQIEQSIVVDLDEEGTKVKAVTYGKGEAGAYLPGRLVMFDEPFLYIIHEKSTGAVLLAGTVNML